MFILYRYECYQDIALSGVGMTSPLINRIIIRNYKSIDTCSIKLNNLMFLVGPNGSGKSNFLDAIRFVSDSLRTSLDHALRDRGTIKDVRRRSGGHPNHFALRIDFTLPNGCYGHYSFQVGAKPAGKFEVQDEECLIRGPEVLCKESYYKVKAGKVIKASFRPAPACLPDRLYLVATSGIPEFRPLFDALSHIEVYNLNPKEIGCMQKPDPGEILRRDGGNAPSVLQRLPDKELEKVNTYLLRIAKGIVGVQAKILGSQETIEFRQVVKGQKHPWQFLASSMSDGTLRAFGILLSIFQSATNDADRPLLIGLEEPEMALHPAAAGVLLSALREGARERQILVTSHSPDLLDNPDIPTESLIAVDSQDGVSIIAPIDQAGRTVMKDKLFTPGELLRQNQLAPDREIAQKDIQQLNLFELNGKKG